jgi:hypothetical protein
VTAAAKQELAQGGFDTAGRCGGVKSHPWNRRIALASSTNSAISPTASPTVTPHGFACVLHWPAALPGHLWVRIIAGDLCQRDQCLAPHPLGSVLGHLVI